MHSVHVDRPRLVLDHEVFRRAWYPVAHIAELVDGPVVRHLLGEELVLWCPPEGGVAAAHNRCPHRDARLSDGWMDTCGLVCPYHGWTFASDGRAARIPQLPPDAALPPRAALTGYRAAERYGWVWVALDEPLLPIPELPEFDAPGWRVVREPEAVWQCSAVLLVDNNIDPAHIAFVHRNSFGTPSRPDVPVPSIAEHPHGLTVTYELPVEGRPGDMRATVRVTENRLHGPLLLILRITYPDGLVHLMIKACTPETSTRTRQLQMVLRNDTEQDRAAHDIVAFDEQVWAEDQAVLERCWPDYRLDVVDNVHLKTDRASIEYRRWLSRIVEGRWTGLTAEPGL